MTDNNASSGETSLYEMYIESEESLSDNTSLITINTTNCQTDDRHITFVFNAVIIGTICVLGIVGNTISILVLQRDHNNKVAIFLLQALAVADNSLLLVSFVTLSLWKGFFLYMYVDQFRLTNSMEYIPVVINPVGAMTQTATIWITVLLAVNRFIAVCKPFKAHKLCTITKAKIQVFIVTSLSIGFNLPRFFQYTIVETYNGNGTNPVLSLNETAIGHSSLFGILYTNALYSVLVLLLPLLLLIVLNTQLLKEIRHSKQRAQRLCHQNSTAASEENISFVMIVIIVVFIVCHTPDRVYQIVSLIMFQDNSSYRCSTLKPRLLTICNLFVVFNSSVNFLVYYICRKSFRKILKQKICNFYRRTSSDLNLSGYKSTRFS